MLFNSVIFVLFVLLFFLFLPWIKRASDNIRWSYFVLASFFFYGWWNWSYLFLIILTGVIDYLAAIVICKYPEYKKSLLLISLTGNIGTLFLFKYAGYFFYILRSLVPLIGLTSNPSPKLPDFFLVLPVGISFYTFQSMSYTIDVYRGKLAPVTNILQFFAFLSLFPQLVAGPIIRAQDFLPQLKRTRSTTETERWNGFRLVALGYFKKTVLADNLAPFVNGAFTNQLTNSSCGYWWLVMIGFAFQIYFDFSGYTDIARGLAKWMGFHFRTNFNHPYISRSFREFWTRWHISLSTWFRDYLYVPLGGSRISKVRSHINLWITMLVSGFWHGAATHFIVWGGLHAAYLSIERITGMPEKLNKYAGTRILSIVITFILTVTAWTFFRAENNSQALTIIGYMFSFQFSAGWGNSDIVTTGTIYILSGFIIEIVIRWLQPYFFRWHRHPVRIVSEFIQVVLLISGTLFLRGVGEQFIYFQF